MAIKKELINQIGSLASSGLGMIGQNARAKKQHERQKELMGVQLTNQQNLNQQGHNLQMETWKKTNYPAQLKMMEEAGLNPGLMYGQGGSGGATTGSQSGGSAQGGQASAPMDIMGIVQAGLMNAQRDKLVAETKNIEANTNKTGNEIDKIKGEIELNASTVLKNMSETEKNKSVTKLNNALKSLNEAKTSEAITNTNINKQELEWMKRTGLNKHDSIITKTTKYLSNTTGLSETQVIGLVGGALALEKIVNSAMKIKSVGKIKDFKN